MFSKSSHSARRAGGLTTIDWLNVIIRWRLKATQSGGPRPALRQEAGGPPSFHSHSPLSNPISLFVLLIPAAFTAKDIKAFVSMNLHRAEAVLLPEGEGQGSGGPFQTRPRGPPIPTYDALAD